MNSPVNYHDVLGLKWDEKSLNALGQKRRSLFEKWLAAAKKTPAKKWIQTLEKDQRPIRVVAAARGSLRGLSARGGPLISVGTRQVTGAKLEIDFDAIMSEKERRKHCDHPEVVIAHETGHIYLAFTNLLRFQEIRSQDIRLGTLVKGLGVEEFFAIRDYEDLVRRSLNIPVIITPAIENQFTTEYLKKRREVYKP